VDGERQWQQQEQQEKENRHREPPTSGTTTGIRLLPVWRSAQAGHKWFLTPFSVSACWSSSSTEFTRCGPKANRYAKEVLAIQEEIGADVQDYLADVYPDWIDAVANETWDAVGGW
jgi:hypothetical protein